MKINNIIKDDKQDHKDSYDKVAVLNNRETQHAVFLTNENVIEEVHKDSTYSVAQSDQNSIEKEE